MIRTGEQGYLEEMVRLAHRERTVIVILEIG